MLRFAQLCRTARGFIAVAYERHRRFLSREFIAVAYERHSFSVACSELGSQMSREKGERAYLQSGASSTLAHICTRILWKVYSYSIV